MGPSLGRASLGKAITDSKVPTTSTTSGAGSTLLQRRG
jgi:hypothetical protein